MRYMSYYAHKKAYCKPFKCTILPYYSNKLLQFNILFSILIINFILIFTRKFLSNIYICVHICTYIFNYCNYEYIYIYIYNYIKLYLIISLHRKTHNINRFIINMFYIGCRIQRGWTTSSQTERKYISSPWLLSQFIYLIKLHDLIIRIISMFGAIRRSSQQNICHKTR